MAAKLGIKIKGLRGATAITQMVEQLVASRADGYVQDTTRKGGKVTNGELLGYLADGGRDITPNPADQKKFAETFRDEFAQKMTLEARTYNTKDRQVKGKLIKGKSGVVSTERATKQGTVSGLRKALKLWAKMMKTRIKKQVDNTGGALKPLKLNEQGYSAYARKRKKEYGVNVKTLLVASRQLAEAIHKGKIKIKIHK